MKTWNTQTIADLGKVVTGKTPPSAKPEEFGDEFPFITPSDIQFGNKHTTTERFLSERGIEAHKRIKLPEKTVCVVCIGATIGKVCYTDQLSISNQQINSIIVDSKKHDPDFVFYIASLLRNTLEAYAGGAATPIVNKSSFSKIKLQVPERATQRKIAAILTAYDDLIETNKRRIALLEKMAEELYREWFVRMRFPGHQNTKFVKGVPEGWPYDFGSTFFDHVKGKSYSSPEISDEEGSCFFITLKSFHRRGGYRKGGLKYYSGSYKDDQCVQTGDVVMAVTDMTQDRAVVGEVARIPSLPGKKAVISLDVMRLLPKEMSTTFLYAYMRHSGFANYIKEFANGANVLHLKPDLVGKQRLLFPPKDLREQFSDLAEPIYQEAGALEEANGFLTQTRDLLLPRLISGKLSVEDLDIQFPPSMGEASLEK
jgi:type I restriction enzyme, S subunit